MISYITYIHLENRILVSEGNRERVMNLADTYSLGIVIGTDGNFQPGPYIERVYKKVNAVISVNQFKEFITSLIPLIDMYRGVFPFTFIEFSCRMLVEENDSKIEIPHTEIVAYMDLDNMFKMKTLNPVVEKIQRLDPWKQHRITREAYHEEKLNMLSLAAS